SRSKLRRPKASRVIRSMHYVSGPVERIRQGDVEHLGKHSVHFRCSSVFNTNWIGLFTIHPYRVPLGVHLFAPTNGRLEFDKIGLRWVRPLMRFEVRGARFVFQALSNHPGTTISTLLYVGGLGESMPASGIHGVEIVFLLLLLFVVVFGVLARKLAVPYPIVLVIGGLLL